MPCIHTHTNTHTLSLYVELTCPAEGVRREGERERERGREGGRERERQRETERDRQRERESLHNSRVYVREIRFTRTQKVFWGGYD